MELPVSARRVPVRVATGTWILHSGIEKWRGGEDEAKVHHLMTAVAFPFVKKVSPRRSRSARTFGCSVSGSAWSLTLLSKRAVTASDRVWWAAGCRARKM